jgi:hypothetical protein
MEHEGEAVLRDIYDAWRVHNLEWLASYLPDDFSHEINVPSEITIDVSADVVPLQSGICQGKQAVLDRLRFMFSQFEVRRLWTGDIVVENDHANVKVQCSCLHRRSGIYLNSIKTNLWRLEAGWPVALCEYYQADCVRAFIDSVVYH